MFRIIEDSTVKSIVKEFGNNSSSKIHEHDFVSIRTKEDKEQPKSIICLTCASVYCEKCGKLVTLSEKNYMQYNLYN
jgi:hypothetical protein